MKASDRPTRRIFLNFVRLFNKYFFNHITLWLAKRGIGPYSVVIHKGRRSGRIYKTPVLASCMDDDIYIPLPYGDHVDWLRNVLAYNGCKIIRKHEVIAALDPVVMEAGTALSALPEGRRELFERFDVEKFLRLRQNIERSSPAT
ncbi:MAG TPA: nitroreductase [Anaerolineae bacterium]|nr:nitroreductase [Anaerolineae bacterium]